MKKDRSFYKADGLSDMMDSTVSSQSESTSDAAAFDYAQVARDSLEMIRFRVNSIVSSLEPMRTDPETNFSISPSTSLT